MFRIRRFFTAVALVTALSIGVSGCFGSFALTRKIYEFNRGLGNKFVRTVVFWAFLIVPVYEVTEGIDFVILNLIEFWTGRNPVSPGTVSMDTRDIQLGGKVLRMTLLDGGKRLRVSELRDGKLTKTLELGEPDAAGEVRATALDGSEVAAVRPGARGLEVEDAQGIPLAGMSSSDLARLESAAAWQLEVPVVHPGLAGVVAH